jgi:hypothetical protein
VRKNKKGEEEGVRMKVFDYTCAKLLTIGKYEALVNAEISRVKALSYVDRVAQKWAGSIERPEGTLWMEDPVEWIKGIGKKKKECLKKANVLKVKDLCGLEKEELGNIQKISRIGVKTLRSFQDDALKAKAGVSPYPKAFDWVTGNRNPYETRYGTEWRSEMKKYSRSGLGRFVCVTDLIEHIDRETAKCFEKTPYANNYYWSHDALSQMCDKRCTEWMIKKGFYERWIKPELGCNDVVTTTTEGGEVKHNYHYKNRPVGDQPELMPLDASLNWDIDCSLNMHVMMTAHLKNDDPLKFSKATPREISKAILKICDPENGVTPSSKRIIQDVKKVLNSIKTIVEAGGKVVPGLVNRNGHRKKEPIDGRKYFPRKEHQVIPTLTELGIFKEVQKVAVENVKRVAAKFNN